jgi:hypothetical protein
MGQHLGIWRTYWPFQGVGEATPALEVVHDPENAEFDILIITGISEVPCGLVDHLPSLYPDARILLGCLSSYGEAVRVRQECEVWRSYYSHERHHCATP